MTPLTAAEESEFTLFNAATFDLLRQESRGTKIPLWLCMSPEARQEAKQKFATWLSGAVHAIVPMTVEFAEKYVQKNWSGRLGELVSRWKSMELEAKRIREDEGNPGAFFV